MKKGETRAHADALASCLPPPLTTAVRVNVCRTFQSDQYHTGWRPNGAVFCQCELLWSPSPFNCFYEQATMMLASTGCCIRNEREPAKAAAPRKTPKHPFNKEHRPRKRSQTFLENMQEEMRQVNGGDGGRIRGNKWFIYTAFRGEYKRTGTLQDHLASRTQTQRFKTECRIGWFMKAGQKDSDHAKPGPSVMPWMVDHFSFIGCWSKAQVPFQFSTQLASTSTAFIYGCDYCVHKGHH